MKKAFLIVFMMILEYKYDEQSSKNFCARTGWVFIWGFDRRVRMAGVCNKTLFLIQSGTRGIKT